MDFQDLSQHPHDRGELTMAELVQFRADWEQAGRPEGDDLIAFLGSHPVWSRYSAEEFRRTGEAMRQPGE